MKQTKSYGRLRQWTLNRKGKAYCLLRVRNVKFIFLVHDHEPSTTCNSYNILKFFKQFRLKILNILFYSYVFLSKYDTKIKVLMFFYANYNKYKM